MTAPTRTEMEGLLDDYAEAIKSDSPYEEDDEAALMTALDALYAERDRAVEALSGLVQILDELNGEEGDDHYPPKLLAALNVARAALATTRSTETDVLQEG